MSDIDDHTLEGLEEALAVKLTVKPQCNHEDSTSMLLPPPSRRSSPGFCVHRLALNQPQQSHSQQLGTLVVCR